MTLVTLSDEQVKLIGEATSPVVLVNSAGRKVGKVTPLNFLPSGATEREVIADIRSRMAEDDGTRFTHSEVMDHLRTLASQ
jgi:hypothetical protein